MKVDILGVSFDAVSPDEAVSIGLEILSEPRGKTARYAVTPNPEIVRACRRDKNAHRAVSGASLVLPDGIGIIYAAKILKKPLKARVTGIEFAEKMFGKCAELGYGVYFLGAKPGVAELAARRLAERYPGLAVRGCSDGYFTDDKEIIARINDAQPDFLIVGLGAPRQEIWMAKNAARLKVKLCAGLGGGIDIFAETVKRAPAAWQKLGIEWLYRLIREPWRIRRMIKLPLFLLTAVSARLTGKS